MKKTLIAMAMLTAGIANAETNNVVLAYQTGWAYLSLHVMQQQHLIEKRAKELGITVTTEFKALGSPAMINDAMNADQVNYGAVGVPSLVILNDKSKGDYKAVGSIVSLPMFFNTTKDVKTICDFQPGDKIALTSVKVSVQAVTLQIAAKKYCGNPFFDDKLTVSSTHPDGMTALLSGAYQAHFTAPPYEYIELEQKGVKKLMSSYDVLGGKSTFIALVGKDSFAKSNPKINQAVYLALEDAQTYINANKAEAAKLYFDKEHPKLETLKDVISQMSGEDVEFTTSAQNYQTYSYFMKEIGTVKTKLTWKDLSFPFIQNKKGD